MNATLYRAADDDTIVDCASFADSLESAKAYLDNPGFGGRSLWVADVECDDSQVIDLREMSHEDAVAFVCDLIDVRDPGAIGVDEWIPRVAGKLRDAGVEWVIVRESYPQDTDTYIFVGSDDPEMVEI